MRLSQVAHKLSLDIAFEQDLHIDGIGNLTESTETELSFILDKKHSAQAESSKACAFITYTKLSNIKKPQIITPTPKESLAKTIELFYPNTKIANEQEPISTLSNIATTASIGHFTTIKSHSAIGENTVVSNHCSIGKNCNIGNNCIIHPNVTIYDNCNIGNNVVIHSGTIIGADGFGFYQKNGASFKIKHIGAVIIEDDVEIGANTCIDKGCLGKTFIGRGAKIDNLVQIAHNTYIHKNCLIAAQVGFTGSSSIQEGVMIGGQAGIDSSEIGKYCIITGRAGVTKDIKAKSIVSGFPAWNHKKELKKEAKIRKLIERN